MTLALAQGGAYSTHVKNPVFVVASFSKVVLPLLLYGLGKYFGGQELGLAFVALAGVIGFALRNWVFLQIEKIYKREKYKTIAAYKQKS